MSILPAALRDRLSGLFGRLYAWWSGLTPKQHLHYSALAFLMVGSVAHFLVFSIYFIEDAGISFAYARNFVEGEGWVTYAGGERVEGFSNPLWTWLIALWYALGVPPWTSSKIMGAAFGAACIPLVYKLSQVSRPDQDDHLDLVAPFLLAASSTAAIWHGSGLENSLFSILLTGGMLAVLRDARHPDKLPLSALLFLGLALTRPEGIMYAAMGGFGRLLLAIRDRRVVGPILRWLVVFFVPFGVYHAWRYDYFAWLWPNTYYAKLDGTTRFQPWKWSIRGWLYLRNYLAAYGFSWLMPLVPIGLLGLRDRRRWVVLGMSALGALLFVWDGRAGLPAAFDPDWLAWLQKHWDHARVLFVLLSAITLGVLTALSKGGVARLMSLLMVSAGVFFIVYSGNDWMAQWRFVSYVIVPGMLLLGLGVAELVACLPLPERLGRLPARAVVTWLILIAMGVPNIWNSAHAAPEPETSVSDVFRRVKYMTWVQRRLHLDHVTLFDVDMGAHMYYTDWRILDVAGLVDVPMARHNYQKSFIREYVLEEGQPEFAHMHGGWASKVRIKTHEEWKLGWIEIPGYPAGGRTLHVGNHVRKDIFARPEYEGPPRREVRYAGGLTLEGWAIPAPEVPQDGELYVEVWLNAGFRKDDLRMLVVIDDGLGNLHTAALPPGYDWYRPAEWQADEHVVHRYNFDLPADLPEGKYDIGFVFLDDKTGRVMKPLSQKRPEGAPIRFMDGAVFFEDALKIVSRDQALAEADADRARMTELARGGQCEAAWQAFREARYHVFKDKAYHERFEPQAESEVAACFAERAQAAASMDDKVAALTQARLYDHHLDLVLDTARPIAAQLDAEGDACAQAEDWECAYARYRDALKLDPRLSWTRRKAEEARDKRLGIEGKEPEKSPLSKKDEDEAGDDEAGEGDEDLREEEDEDEAALRRKEKLEELKARRLERMKEGKDLKGEPTKPLKAPARDKPDDDEPAEAPDDDEVDVRTLVPPA
ncbi:MAG: hypothetical protein H6741_10035 [Alphaproteobacteria bacterium]|nr:hypothetical protein [Alphaproteobacteria bacterium]